jgi:hypothetical protein
MPETKKDVGSHQHSSALLLMPGKDSSLKERSRWKKKQNPVSCQPLWAASAPR